MKYCHHNLGSMFFLCHKYSKWAFVFLFSTYGISFLLLLFVLWNYFVIKEKFLYSKLT